MIVERVGDCEAAVEQPQRAFAQRGGFGEIDVSVISVGAARRSPRALPGPGEASGTSSTAASLRTASLVIA